MTRAAACLLLLAAPAVAAEEPAGAVVVAGDRDGDGVLSKKEARQLRRAERRARRRAQGLPDEPEDADDDAAAAEEASERSSAASAKAASAASAMKGLMTPEEAAGGMAPGKTGAADSPGPGGAKGGRSAPAVAARSGGGAPSTTAAAPSGDPASPSSASDFVLAARGGYAPAFAKAGLKLSTDGRSIIRLDGSPATAADYARLGAEIRSMPAAASRRSDFFTAVSPARFADLKHGLKKKPELSKGSLKDAGLSSDERDIVHTRTCSKVEGGCNESVADGSYKKGDFVDPEDLDRMWEAMEKELAGGVADPGRAPSLASGPARTARVDASASVGVVAGGSPHESGQERTLASTAEPAASAVAGFAAAAGKSARTAFAMIGFGRRGATDAENASWPALAIAALAAAVVAAAFSRRRGSPD